MSFRFVDPGLYHKHRETVLALARGNLDTYQGATLPPRALADAEIAKILDLDERDVMEIRCVGERDTYPLAEFERARRFKEKACKTFRVANDSRQDDV